MTQYDCNFLNKAPVGCDQWLYTPTGAGYIYSFGHGSARHFGHQHQTTCIRYEWSTTVNPDVFNLSYLISDEKVATVVSATLLIQLMMLKLPWTQTRPVLWLLAQSVVDMVHLEQRLIILELTIAWWLSGLSRLQEVSLLKVNVEKAKALSQQLMEPLKHSAVSNTWPNW